MSEVFPRGGLPPIQFVDVDPIAEEARALARYQDMTGEVLATSDPRRLFISSLVSILVQKNVETDLAAKQTLLSYSQGAGLDNLGALTDTPRLPSAKAVTTIRFTLSAARPSAVTIPAGTQIAAGLILFATVQPLTIPAGSITGEVTAEALVAGVESNGIVPGQLRTIVVPIPYVEQARNTTVTAGGADEEKDDAYALRLHGATDKISVAGPRKAYIQLALGVSPAIVDVSVHSPSPTVVHVYPLLHGGEIPSQTLLDLVEEKLSGEDVRPDTDFVHVLAPTSDPLDVSVRYWISTSDLARAVQIQAAVEEAVDEYVLWQVSAIGRDIVPDQLVVRMIRAGAKRVVVDSPSFTIVEPTHVAQLSSRVVSYQGVEDD